MTNTKLKGTQTEKNLQEAFSGESQARNKYTFFASKAKKDGFVQISKIFEETANNEKEHAEIWFKLLGDGIGSTAENLLAAAEGEHGEWVDMYKNFAIDARKEGLEDIAVLFDSVALIEKQHEERYRNLLKNIETGTVFKKSEVVEWECSNCGHTYKGKEAIDLCPVCEHPKAYFMLRVKNY